LHRYSQLFGKYNKENGTIIYESEYFAPTNHICDNVSLHILLKKDYDTLYFLLSLSYEIFIFAPIKDIAIKRLFALLPFFALLTRPSPHRNHYETRRAQKAERNS
jgi:hypothetical protein